MSTAEETTRKQLIARISEHLPNLQARLRKRQLDDLIEVIELRDRGYERLCDRAQIPAAQSPLMILTLAMLDAIRVFKERRLLLKRRFDNFAQRYFRRSDRSSRDALLTDYLRISVRDRNALAADVRAMKRYLGYDVLVERHAASLHDYSVCIELGLLFVNHAVQALLEACAGESADLLLSEARIDVFAFEEAMSAERWQEQLPALDILCTLYRALRKDHILDVADPTIMRRALRFAEMSETHPWLQARALEIGLILDTNAGMTLLSRRLLNPQRSRSPESFLVRRAGVRLLSRYARNQPSIVLLGALIEIGDPSEHVRIGICEALVDFAAIGGVALLHRLTGERETSAKVRAKAALSLVTIARDADSRTIARESLTALNDLLTRERDELVLGVTCAALRRAAERVAPTGARSSGRAREFARHVARPLTTILTDPSRTPAVVERVAESLEVLERQLSFTRRRWTSRLCELARTIPPGRSRNIERDCLAQGLPPIDDREHFLGRVLADITRDDWGLTVASGTKALHLTRGDRFHHRAWRVLHELRHLSPNKRQGFSHSVGRNIAGELRAPPGRLHEITPTVVPGERLHVEREAGWARHLPLVDDIIGLPILSRRPVNIYSSHGITQLMPPTSLMQRLRNRLLLVFRYTSLAALRIASLSAELDDERRRYVDELRQRYGVDTHFTPYLRELPGSDPQRFASPHVLSVMPPPEAPLSTSPQEPPTIQLSASAAVFIAPIPWDRVADVLGSRFAYFMSLAENSHQALALFTAALLGWFLIAAFFKRRRIRAARAAIPLSIGGWGTRGKSGTERLKAGLFSGLGFHVFSKTTGCEAMMVHSRGSDAPEEVFVFRPFGKATIWEQRDMLEFGAALGTEVFLWECMALNPLYVHLLEHSWMRDDLTTLTNAYPDHEDIQGPAGHDVARVISSFIPQSSTLVTSETNFRAMFAERCRELDTEMHEVDEFAGDLIASDLLELFPYSEHPTNIALVETMATTLGIDPELAIYTMAKNVVPDLGVLKIFPKVLVLGRALTFINGMSANERTGFMNNWRRTGCAEIDSSTTPGRFVITVINNRADRISRSEVFARILAHDIDADRHVLIGSNLKGLIGYLDAALRQVPDAFVLITPKELSDGVHDKRARNRFAVLMRRLRIPEVSADSVIERLSIYAAGTGLALGDTNALRSYLQGLFQRDDGSNSAATNEAQLRADQSLRQHLESALVPLSEGNHHSESRLYEVLEDESPDCLFDHFIDLVTTLVTRKALEQTTEQAIQNATASVLRDLHATITDAYCELFRRKLVVLWDPGISGDQIITRCARALPPGTDVTIIGAQNIKGTGLDFAYRWLALGRVSDALKKLRSEHQKRRFEGFEELEGFEDFGLVDSGLAVAELTRMRGTFADNRSEIRLDRVASKIEETYRARVKALAATGSRSLGARLIDWLEGWIDFVDSIRRRRESNAIVRDLIDQRISHGRAAAEMRMITGRQKGGWLRKRWKK